MSGNGKLVEKVDLFIQLKREIDRLEKERKQLREELMQLVGDSGSLRDATGRLVAVIVKTRKSVDTKRLKDEQPEIYEHYLKETEYCQLEVSPQKLSSELEALEDEVEIDL